MGLYFNTDASIEMLDIVNSEFQNANIKKWQGRKEAFDSANGNSLDAIAAFWKVHPKKNAGKKGRWLAWLQYLHTQPSPVLGPYALPPLADTPYPVPVAQDPSTVGEQLSRLMFQALSDANCSEIMFVLLPDTKVRVVSARTIAPTEGGYSLVLTLSTIELPAKVKARLIKKLTLRSKPQAIRKKKQ